VVTAPAGCSLRPDPGLISTASAGVGPLQTRRHRGNTESGPSLGQALLNASIASFAGSASTASPLTSSFAYSSPLRFLACLCLATSADHTVCFAWLGCSVACKVDSLFAVALPDGGLLGHEHRGVSFDGSVNVNAKGGGGGGAWRQHSGRGPGG